MFVAMLLTSSLPASWPRRWRFLQREADLQVVAVEHQPNRPLLRLAAHALQIFDSSRRTPPNKSRARPWRDIQEEHRSRNAVITTKSTKTTKGSRRSWIRTLHPAVSEPSFIYLSFFVIFAPFVVETVRRISTVDRLFSRHTRSVHGG